VSLLDNDYVKCFAGRRDYVLYIDPGLIDDSFFQHASYLFGSFPTRLNSVVLTEFSSYLAFVLLEGTKPNGSKISSNESCRALSI
jgi:hypothetical protein